MNTGKSMKREDLIEWVKLQPFADRVRIKSRKPTNTHAEIALARGGVIARATSMYTLKQIMEAPSFMNTLDRAERGTFFSTGVNKFEGDYNR